MKFKTSRLWLCLPFALIFLVDAGITLAGQPGSYWAGNRQSANEAFPVFYWALSIGPWAFVLLCLAWFSAFSALIAFMPHPVSAILSLALVNGHTWGSMTWLVYHIQLDYHLCLLFFVFSASIFIGCQTKTQKARQLESAREKASGSDSAPASL